MSGSSSFEQVTTDALAGVYGFGRARDRARTRIEQALAPPKSDWLRDRELAAARQPAKAASDIATTGCHCFVVGSIDNIESLASSFGVTREASPEIVVARAYERWGTAMLDHLRGRFAVLAWDFDRQRGFLAEDQLGNRSLFVAAAEGNLFFASEIDLLLGMLPRRPSPDQVALAHWLQSCSVPTGRTLYEGVERVGPGCLLEFDDGRWKRLRYWQPRYDVPLRLSRSDAVASVWAGVTQAVSARMRTGRIGIVMSGGIDSSAVAAAAASVGTNGNRPRGYSAVFLNEPRVDESERITELTDALNLPSVQVDVQPGGWFALSLEYLRRWQVPLPGTGYLIEQPLLQHAADDGVTAVLDGQGGDEIFGLSPYLIADRLQCGRLVSLLQLTRRLAGAGGPPPWRSVARLVRQYGIGGAIPHGLHRRLRRLRGRDLTGTTWLLPPAARTLRETDDPWAWKAVDGVPRWWAFQADLLTNVRQRFGIPDYMRRRAAMSGLEARTPLLDLDLVELVLRLPPELLFDSDVDRPLIREGMRGLVPDSVRLSRQKSNLAPFFYRSLAGPDLAPIRRLLGASDAELRAYVPSETLQALVERPPNLGEPGWMQWTLRACCLATAEAWLRYQADSSFPDRLLVAPDVRRPEYEVSQTRS